MPTPAPQQASGPMVLVYTGTDDPSRGDAHGAEGVGQKIAEKIGGAFHFIGDKDLDRLYPEEKTKTAALAHYFRDHGYPDVLMSKFWRIHDPALGKHKPLIVFEDNNEYLSHKYLNDRSLVNHHVTAENLKEEGGKFAAAYPSLPSPLIGVLMAQLSDIKGFAEKLVSKAAAYPQSAIFVTSIWRTRPENYKELMEEIARQAGAKDRITIIGHPFSKEPGYNPYLGLLDRADQIVVTGHSLSMMTEPLTAGKAPLLFEPGQDHSALEQRGLVRDFNKSAAKTPFDNAAITPFNPTEIIARKMTEEFNKKAFWNRLNPKTWVKKIVSALKR